MPPSPPSAARWLARPALAAALLIAAGCAAGLTAAPAPSAGPGVSPRATASVGTGASASAMASVGIGASGAAAVGPGRGFPARGPWLTYYGDAQEMGDLAALARRYRIFTVEADPGVGAFTPAQIATLRAEGANRVLGYLNLGSVEDWRDYWREAPPGLVPAGRNTAARIGPYAGYDDEFWMHPGDPAWRRLLLEHVAPRLVGQGVDGFYFDNLELLAHGEVDPDNGPCDAGCRDAGFALVRDLRAKYPGLLFVMQNGTEATTRLGEVGGVRFAALLDGVAHESVFTQPSEADDAKEAVYTVATDPEVLTALDAWRALDLRPGGRPFWIGAMEYVNRCDNVDDATRVRASAEAHGLAVAIADKSALLQTVCPWPF